MEGKINQRVAALAVLLQITAAFNCSIQPLYVDIHKRAVHGTPAYQYGSFIGIGSPAQNQSIWPSLRQNETSFASSDFCTASNLTNCTTSTGGTFDIADSKSWIPASTNELSRIANNDGNFTSGKDLIHLYTHYFQTDGAWETNVADTPVMIGTSGNKNPGVLGIGSGSTLLQRLYDVGLIAAKTYSLYIGAGFDRAGGIVNGSNTFGGYDAGRFEKPVFTYPMDLASDEYLPVSVADIIIDDPSDPSRNRISIMLEDKSFQARITTDRYQMLFPYHVAQGFMSILGARTVDGPENSLQLNRPFNGTMTIKLSDGFNVTIPASTLFNASGISSVENTPKDYNGPFYLSASFLSQVYLMMDFEARQFHLAKAIQFAPYIMPKTFCPGSIPEPHDYSSSGRSTFSKAGLSGVIVGSVVGGLALIVGSWVAFVTWQRRKIIHEQESRWAAEEKQMALQSADVEMQCLTPPPANEIGFIPIPPKAYSPVIERGEDGRGSPVSDMSRSSSLSSGRPDSLRRER